jgi:hypothetical protein
MEGGIGAGSCRPNCVIVHGAGSYLLRLQAAHTFEGLKVIGKIKKISAFMEKLERCDVPTQEAFSRLAAFIGTGFKLRMIAS